MNSPTRRMIFMLAISLSAYLVFVFGWAAFHIPALDLVPSQVFRWVLTRVLNDFGRIIPQAVVLAIAVWASLLLDETDLRETEAGLRIVKTVLVVALVVSGYQATHALLIGPGLEWQNRAAVERSRLVQDLRTRIQDYTGRREFADARQAVELLARVDPGLEAEVRAARAFITAAEREERERQEQETLPGEQSVHARRTPSGRTAVQFMQAARLAMEREDYVTAHLEARRAFDMDPRNMAAWRLAEEAWSRIASGDFDEEELTGVQRSKRSVQMLMQASRYVEAYYELQAFAAEHPDDPDLLPLREVLAERLDGISFFLDELQSLDAGPAGPGLLFVQESDSGGHELIRIGATVGQPIPRFAIGVEALSLGSDHQLVYHLQTDSARFHSSSLILRGLHRDDESLIQQPRYIVGSRDEALQPLLGLRVPLVQLVAVSRGQNTPLELNGFDLYRLVTANPDTARFVPGMQIELFRRMVSPVTVTFVSLVMFALAYRLRRRGGSSLGIRGILSVAILPALIVGIFALIEQAQVSIAAMLILVSGALGAALILGFIQVVLVAVGIVFAIRAVA